MLICAFETVNLTVIGLRTPDDTSVDLVVDS
jgi:hypothetical protein